MSTLFLLFVAAVVSITAWCVHRWLPAGYKRPALLTLALWLLYGTALGLAGIIADISRIPPGMFYLLAPTIMLVMFTARSNAGLVVAKSIPVWVLTGFESFRLGVEGFLHMLWLDGQLPTMLTFHGANFDVLIGATAPIVAWLIVTGAISNRAAVAWHVAGIAFLANVAIRGALTTPGTLRLLATEVPNLAVTTFPFTFIPAFLVPLALVLHVLSIRALRARMSARTDIQRRPAKANARDPGAS